MTETGTYLRWGATCAVAIIVTYVLWPRMGGSEAERRARLENRVEITYWDRHAGHEHEARLALINEFNAAQHTIYVRAVPVGFNAASGFSFTLAAGKAGS